MMATSTIRLRRLLAGSALFAVAAAAQADTAGAEGASLPGWEWTKITPEPTRVFGMDVLPSCSGLPIEGVDTHTFSFWVKRGDPRKLVVYFEGGGACWDARTCLGIQPDGTRTDPTFVPFIDPAFDPGAPERRAGIFDPMNPDNPVGDWSFVYIPYCTGDIHAGSREQEINAGPFSVTIHHRGSDNALAALAYAFQNFAPRQLLVAGSSAGGYGAILNLPWAKLAFPFARTAVIQDSAQGVTPSAWDAIRDEAWNFRLAPWLFLGEPRPVGTDTILQRTFAAYPDIKFAQYTRRWDLVQTLFYDLQLDSIGEPQTGTTCSAWESEVRESVQTLQAASNFRSYIASGTQHTVLRSAEFYTEDSAGPMFAGWLAAMLRDQGGRWGPGSPTWQNASCTGDCGMPPECPF